MTTWSHFVSKVYVVGVARAGAGQGCTLSTAPRASRLGVRTLGGSNA